MKEKFTSVGALISAAFASVCCLGPLLPVGLGLGGAGLAAGFAKYRPLFLGLTAVFLGVAFYQTYRKKEVACADGTCELRSGSRRMKATLWVITGIAALLATFPQWSSHVLRSTAAPLVGEMTTVSLKISGMHCAACATSIESSLNKVPGVQSASVNYDQSEAVIFVEPGKVKEDELLEAVQTAGPYQAEIKNK